jgi:protein SCO1/2
MRPGRAEAFRTGALPWGTVRWTVLVLAAIVVAAACTGDEPLPGTNLSETPAPDFRLTDQAGRVVTMSGLRGKGVVLTFIYATCPDFCPATAAKLRQTLDLLGQDADRVALVAVSVDPEQDDRRAAQEFTARHRLPEESWHYLIGAEDELAPVWQAYGIGRIPRAPGVPPSPGASIEDVLGHTEALYVIDTRGRERTLIRGDFKPAELAKALRRLTR